MNYEFEGKFVNCSCLLTVLRCPCTAKFIEAELVTFMHQGSGHTWRNGRYKKLICITSGLYGRLRDFYFRHLHQQARKCFSLKSLPAVTAKRAARSMTGLTLLYHNFIQANNYGTFFNFIMEQN